MIYQLLLLLKFIIIMIRISIVIFISAVIIYYMYINTYMPIMWMFDSFLTTCFREVDKKYQLAVLQMIKVPSLFYRDH